MQTLIDTISKGEYFAIEFDDSKWQLVNENHTLSEAKTLLQLINAMQDLNYDFCESILESLKG